MTATLIIGGLVCAWAVLRILGAERERTMRDLEYLMQIRAASLEAEQAATEITRPSVRSQDGR